jgi:hypothetical protein
MRIRGTISKKPLTEKGSFIDSLRKLASFLSSSVGSNAGKVLLVIDYTPFQKGYQHAGL